ncbi:MAG: c-type cytochrome [Cytophagales bacterium]|nr:c-type cytochrome [Rhizobacter sp.]
MNFLERIPTRWLLAGAAMACLALWAAPSSAQTSGDPAAGKRLFEDTANESGVFPQLGTCTNCHNVQERRNRIATGSPANTNTPIFTAVTFDRAISRFGTAIGGNYSGVMGQFSQLSPTQIGDISAYLADTPKTSVALLTFTASAINTNTTALPVDLSNSITSGALTIPNGTGVTITGSGAARFTLTTDSCSAQTLAASTLLTTTSCRISVRFSAPDMAAYAASLTLSMRVQGSGTTFTRVVPLSGQVGTPTPTPTPSGGDSGGGALGWVWLSGLALATAVLARRRRT